MPTNYDQKRLIGWVRTDTSSNITGFVQSGDYFRLTGVAPYQEVNDSTITANTYETATLTVPPLSEALLNAVWTNTAEGATDVYLYVMPEGANDGVGAPLAYMTIRTASAGDHFGKAGSVLVSASSQIEYAASEVAGTSAVDIRVWGCILHTRSNPQ